MSDYAIDELRGARPLQVQWPSRRRSSRAHKLAVPFDVHRAILAGRTPGLLDRGKPEWSVGEHVQVSTATTPDDRRSEDPARMTVTALQPFMVCDLQADQARAVGLRLATEVQRLALSLPLETPAARVNMLARSDQSTVWLTSWTRVEVDAVRLCRNAGRQAPSTPLQWRPVDAGESVPADYQRTVSEASSETWQVKREKRLEDALQARRASKAKSTPALREATRRRRIVSTRDEDEKDS